MATLHGRQGTLAGDDEPRSISAGARRCRRADLDLLMEQRCKCDSSIFAVEDAMGGGDVVSGPEVGGEGAPAGRASCFEPEEGAAPGGRNGRWRGEQK